MRDKIAYGYDAIDVNILWETSNTNINELNDYCKEIIENDEKDI